MKPKSDEKEVVGFHFQEIPLEDARSMVLAGDGNYSELKSTLLSKIPQLSENTAFAFGLPGKPEIPEIQRRGICKALNLTLKHAGIHWKVTYTNIKRLFLVVPKESHAGKTLRVAPNRPHLDPTTIATAVRLKKSGMQMKEICKKLGLTYGQVNYLIYMKSGIAKSSATPLVMVDPKTSTMENIIKTACKLWTLDESTLLSKNAKAELWPYRKAIQFVAVKHLGIKRKEVASTFSLTKSAIKQNLATMGTGDKEAVAGLLSKLQ